MEVKSYTQPQLNRRQIFMSRKPQPPIPPPPPKVPDVPVVPLADKASLSIKEAAELMSMGTTSVRLLIKSEKLRAVHIGRALIIARQEIDRFLAEEAGAPASAPRYATILRAMAQAHSGLQIVKDAVAELNKAIAEVKAEVAVGQTMVAEKERRAS